MARTFRTRGDVEETLEDGIVIERKRYNSVNRALMEHTWADGDKWIVERFGANLRLQQMELRVHEVYDWNPRSGHRKECRVNEVYSEGHVEFRSHSDEEGVIQEAFHYKIDGALIAHQVFTNGTGPFVGYNENGGPYIVGHYQNGEQHGKWIQKCNDCLVVTEYRNGEERGEKKKDCDSGLFTFLSSESSDKVHPSRGHPKQREPVT